MKVLFVCKPWTLGESGWRPQCIYDILRFDGHDVGLVCAYPFKDTIKDFKRICKAIINYNPDWVLVTSRANWGLIKFLRARIYTKIVLWDPDEIMDENDNNVFRRLRGDIDLLIQEHKVLADKYKHIASLGSYWLPACFELYMEPTINGNKLYNAGFAGFISTYRAEILAHLLNKLPPVNVVHNSSIQGILKGETLGNFYARCKIALGIPRQKLWTKGFATSSRIFQVLGSGSFCIINRMPGMEILFKEEKHLVTYENEKDLLEKAQYYLEHDKEREIIAEQGRQLIYEKHLSITRANECWNLLKRLKDK